MRCRSLIGEPLRPFTLDYINRLVEGFIELHGDRAFRDDGAIVGGVGKFRGKPVMVIGHQKGRGTKENIKRNFGQPRPEGFRKARRLLSVHQAEAALEAAFGRLEQSGSSKEG